MRDCVCVCACECSAVVLERQSHRPFHSHPSSTNDNVYLRNRCPDSIAVKRGGNRGDEEGVKRHQQAVVFHPSQRRKLLLPSQWQSVRSALRGNTRSGTQLGATSQPKNHEPGRTCADRTQATTFSCSYGSESCVDKLLSVCGAKRGKGDVSKRVGGII